MGKRTGNPNGRPPKADDEKTVVKPFTLARPVVDRLENEVPKGKRSAFVQAAIIEKLGPADRVGGESLP